MLPSKEQQLSFNSHLKDELLLSAYFHTFSFRSPLASGVFPSVSRSLIQLQTSITLGPFVRETLHEHQAIRDLQIKTFLSLHSLLRETGYAKIKVGL